MNELKIKDKVALVKEPETQGFIVKIDDNLKDVTTCNVVWGCETYEESLRYSREMSDIQWTNKLMKVA